MFPTVHQREVNIQYQDKSFPEFFTPHTVSLFSPFFLDTLYAVTHHIHVAIYDRHRYRIYSTSSLQAPLRSACIARPPVIHTRRPTVQVL